MTRLVRLQLISIECSTFSALILMRLEEKYCSEWKWTRFYTSPVFYTSEVFSRRQSFCRRFNFRFAFIFLDDLTAHRSWWHLRNGPYLMAAHSLGRPAIERDPRWIGCGRSSACDAVASGALGGSPGDRLKRDGRFGASVALKFVLFFFEFEEGEREREKKREEKEE